MKQILVTGGAGYIGSHTALALHNDGFSAVIIDDLSNSTRHNLEKLQDILGNEIPFYNISIHDTAGVETILQQHDIEGVIHFAAFKAVAESVENPLAYYRNNVSDFITLLQTLLKHDVDHFIFSSSAAVYGNPSSDSVTEETPCAPTSPYGWSKYMDEIILRDTCMATPTLHGTALRYFNVVGAHESGKLLDQPKGRPQNLLPLIVQAADGIIDELTVFGNDYSTPDGTCLRDYIHVSDLAKAHVAALQHSLKTDPGYNVFDLGTGKPTSVLELITTFQCINAVSVPYRIGPRRAGDPVAYFAKAEKANKTLGWKATKTIEDAVRDSWKAHTSYTNPPTPTKS